VPEDPRDNGDYFSGDGFLSKVGNFLHRADRASERGAHTLASGLERTGQTVANSLGLDSIGDYLGADAVPEEQRPPSRSGRDVVGRRQGQPVARQYRQLHRRTGWRGRSIARRRGGFASAVRRHRASATSLTHVRRGKRRARPTRTSWTC
jgi:hypothetical protein